MRSAPRLYTGIVHGCALVYLMRCTLFYVANVVPHNMSIDRCSFSNRIAKSVFNGQRWRPRERSIICLQFLCETCESYDGNFTKNSQWIGRGRKWITFYFEWRSRWHCNRCGTTHEKWWRSALKPLLCCWLRWRWTHRLLRWTIHDGSRLIRINRHNDEMGWTRWRNMKWAPIDRCGFCWIHFHFVFSILFYKNFVQVTSEAFVFDLFTLRSFSFSF